MTTQLKRHIFNLALVQPRVFVKTVAATGTPERATALGTISSITATLGGRVATLTFAAAHQAVSGDMMVLSGLNQPEFNGTFGVTVTSATVLTIDLPFNASVATATGTGAAYLKLEAHRLLFYGRNAVRTANTGAVYFGFSATNDTQPFTVNSDTALDGTALASVYVIEPMPGCKYDLSTFYIDVATNADGLLILIY